MNQSFFIALALLFFSFSVASGQEVSDAALAECQKDPAEFGHLAACLPETHVAGEMLALVQTSALYGVEGRDLVSECTAINSSTPAIWACTYAQLLMAYQAGTMIGDLARLDDPVIERLADPARFALLRATMHDALLSFGVPPMIEIPLNTNMLLR